MLSPEHSYQILCFLIGMCPIYFLFQDGMKNEHDEYWIGVGIILAFIIDLITYYTLKHVKLVNYIRDAVLGFQVATCMFASVRQAIISHPQIDTEKDGNIWAGWLLMFMSLTAHNLLRLHQIT